MAPKASRPRRPNCPTTHLPASRPRAPSKSRGDGTSVDLTPSVPLSHRPPAARERGRSQGLTSASGGRSGNSIPLWATPIPRGAKPARRGTAFARARWISARWGMAFAQSGMSFAPAGMAFAQRGAELARSGMKVIPLWAASPPTGMTLARPGMASIPLWATSIPVWAGPVPRGGEAAWREAVFARS
jgi:hypothetical protein